MEPQGEHSYLSAQKAVCNSHVAGWSLKVNSYLSAQRTVLRHGGWSLEVNSYLSAHRAVLR